MAGAFSLFLGLLGLGAAGAVSAGQNAKIKKADYQYGEEHGLHGTSEVLQMREQVRKEWWSICGKTYNVCERPACGYHKAFQPHPLISCLPDSNYVLGTRKIQS